MRYEHPNPADAGFSFSIFESDVLKKNKAAIRCLGKNGFTFAGYLLAIYWLSTANNQYSHYASAKGLFALMHGVKFTLGFTGVQLTWTCDTQCTAFTVHFIPVRNPTNGTGNREDNRKH